MLYKILHFFFFINIFISFSAWLAAAVDTNRIPAAIPIVMNLVNFLPVNMRKFLLNFFMTSNFV
jgi:hypothetical protein